MQDNKQSSKPPAAAGGLAPDIVRQIPVAAPSNPIRAGGEDDELDKIMRDVGHDLKQVGKKEPNHHWFSKQKKSEAEPKFSARPIQPLKPAPAAPRRQPDTAASPTTARPSSQPAIVAKTKPQKTTKSPVGTVILALIVTGGLIAAAYFAYK